MFLNSNKNKKNRAYSKPSLSLYAVLLALSCLTNSGQSFAGTNAALVRVSLAIGSSADTFTPERNIGSSHYTWGAAEVSLLNAGYAKPKRVAVVEEVYWFNVTNRGKPMTIGVAMNSGDIVRTYQAAN